MECANHPGRASAGYCKKCGKFGCGECLVKVEFKGGKVGQKGSVTEALICRECLEKTRQGRTTSKAGQKSARKSSRKSSARRSGRGMSKIAKAAGAVILVAAGITVAVMYVPRINISHQGMNADEVAAQALDALAAGSTDRFLECVDVVGFVCGMDATGLVKRDYDEANRSRKKELLASHRDYVKKDFFISENMRKKYSVVKCDMEEEKACIQIRPWIQFGNRLYKEVLMEKRMGEWRISGLASPDY